MKLIIEISNGLYANLEKIKYGSIAGKVILECVKKGVKADANNKNINEVLDKLSADICQRCFLRDVLDGRVIREADILAIIKKYKEHEKRGLKNDLSI